MSVREKYQSLLDLAGQGGVGDLQVSEEGDVLHVSGTAPSEEAKQKLWDEYQRIDPDMRSGDLVLNISVGGGQGVRRFAAPVKNRVLGVGRAVCAHRRFAQEVNVPDHERARREVVCSLPRHRPLGLRAVVSLAPNLDGEDGSALEEFHGRLAA